MLDMTGDWGSGDGFVSNIMQRHLGRSTMLGKDAQQQDHQLVESATYEKRERVLWGELGPLPMTDLRPDNFGSDQDEELILIVIVIKNIPFAVKKELLQDILK
ncbi:hypothetical protein MMC11_001706 [Xylographa trunciseda]|nr:hypothetical protein [Xylographa trunciseda]